MDTSTLNKVLQKLSKEIKKWKVPAVGAVADRAIDHPFETLVSTILSLRTKDAVTESASQVFNDQIDRLRASALRPERNAFRRWTSNTSLMSQSNNR